MFAVLQYALMYRAGRAHRLHGPRSVERIACVVAANVLVWALILMATKPARFLVWLGGAL